VRSRARSVGALDQQPANMQRRSGRASSAPKIAVDPMMAEGGGAREQGLSFSDLEEYSAKEVLCGASSATNPTGKEALPATVFRPREPEKPKFSREQWLRSIKEIRGVPPIDAVSVAGRLPHSRHCVVGFWHAHSQHTRDGGPVRLRPHHQAPAQPTRRAVPPHFCSRPAQTAPQPEAPTRNAVEERAAADVPVAAKSRNAKNRKARRPQRRHPRAAGGRFHARGAQVQVDVGEIPAGSAYTIGGMGPGAHDVISKSGFDRNPQGDVTSANKRFVSVRLTA